MFVKYRPGNIFRCFHTDSVLLKTFYDVLEVDKKCSSKEIKAAYIKLSKQLHPDLNPKNPEAHQKFVLINQAYHVLGNANTRAMYDRDLRNRQFLDKHSANSEAEFSKFRQAWKDESIWSMRDRAEDQYYKDKPYYGIKGLKRISNMYIVCGCLFFMSVGAVGHYFAIQYGRGMTNEKLNAQDRKNSETYMKVREQAQLLGNQGQLDILERLDQSNEQNDGQRNDSDD